MHGSLGKNGWQDFNLSEVLFLCLLDFLFYTVKHAANTFRDYSMVVVVLTDCALPSDFVVAKVVRIMQ